MKLTVLVYSRSDLRRCSPIIIMSVWHQMSTGALYNKLS